MDVIKRHWPWLFLIIALGGIVTLFRQCRTYNENSQDEHILAAAKKYGVEPALVKAVVWRESRFDPRVRGDAGEIGLMQVGKLAAEEWAEADGRSFFQHRDLFDPAKNTEAGTWYLRKMLRRYAHTDAPMVFALADYNAGRSNVLRWNKGAASTNSVLFLQQMDFPGTRKYIGSILQRYEKYKGRFPARQS
jgi:soluble lytic murein transglycosylase